MEKFEIVSAKKHESNPITLPTKRATAEYQVEVSESFLKNLQNKSPLTKETYRKELKEFFRFLASTNLSSSIKPPKDFADLRRAHIVDYVSWLISQNKKPRTINKKISSIRSFCSYLAVEDILDKDITYGVKTLSLRKNAKDGVIPVETGAFKETDVKQLFECLNPKDKRYFHYRAFLAVGFYVGLRASEIRNLKIGDIHFNGEVHTLTTNVKHHKTNSVTLNPVAMKMINEHKSRLEEFGFKLDDEHYLFPNLHYMKNKPYSSVTLWKMFQKIIDKSELELDSNTRFTTHSMRATLATTLFRKKTRLEDVQAVLGHSRPETTQIYDKSEPDFCSSPLLGIKY